MTSGGLGVLTLAATLLTGCPGAEAGQKATPLSQPVSPGHVFARVVANSPSQAHRFSTWRKMNPVWWFGNTDEPVAPDWYRSGKRGRNFMWHLRNPCHNFDFYVIGVADKPSPTPTEAGIGRFAATNGCGFHSSPTTAGGSISTVVGASAGILGSNSISSFCHGRRPADAL